MQVCEDIVHVDPLPIAASRNSTHATETYASSKAYPAWWSDLDESRVLRRRKSMGDSILERNLCFVDTSSSTTLDHIVRYAEEQLCKAIEATTTELHDFAALLSGRGGPHVDVILYLVSKGESHFDWTRWLADETQRISLRTSTASNS